MPSVYFIGVMRAGTHGGQYTNGLVWIRISIRPNYDKFKEQGWPLSSGKVEGGHIHFIHPISKRGSGWLVPNLNNTLALACIRQSGWWDEFWKLAKTPLETTPDVPTVH